MNDLNERLRIAKARNELAVLDDDTAIEEDLAALYLCLSLKKLGELRGNGGGPEFVKPQDPRAVGRNQPVSYVMRELRKWRKSMSADSNLAVARRQGLAGWFISDEPFWADERGQIIDSAVSQDDPDWCERFLLVLSGRMNLIWMTPHCALEKTWRDIDSQRKLADEFFAALESAREVVQASCLRSVVTQCVDTYRVAPK